MTQQKEISYAAKRERRIRETAEGRAALNSKQRQYRIDNPERYMLSCAKERAKRLGLEFNLDLSDIVIPTHCPVLGIELNPANRDMYSTPSLDRIDSRKGYTKGNVIVVSTRANLLKKDATPDELRMLADFYEQYK
ncbi:hypothetical protein [Azonexus hydrophilus]|uniref:hypothetical protein n=1 Tax=Azonexus hydrophilus TaxID=418702 RepID=UPI0012F78E6F|nr:hypothetical protein [Azonexus hydrophilus]